MAAEKFNSENWPPFNRWFDATLPDREPNQWWGQNQNYLWGKFAHFLLFYRKSRFWKFILVYTAACISTIFPILMMITMVKILRANAKALTTKKPESAIAKGLFNSEKEAGWGFCMCQVVCQACQEPGASSGDNFPFLNFCHLSCTQNRHAGKYKEIFFATKIQANAMHPIFKRGTKKAGGWYQRRSF